MRGRRRRRRTWPSRCRCVGEGEGEHQPQVRCLPLNNASVDCSATVDEWDALHLVRVKRLCPCVLALLQILALSVHST